jgi:iron complex transport system ATP-binding protein
VSGLHIQVEDLRWEPSGVVLDGIGFTVQPGTLCVLLGPNGCGKTSTLRCIAGVLTPDAGVVRLDGDTLADLGLREAARRRAFVSQEQPAELELTVMETVLIGRTPHKRRLEGDAAQDFVLARRALADHEIAELEDRTLPTLSGGERQRTFLARADVQATRAVILDEPTNHLDLRHQHLLLRRLRDGEATSVVSLHDPQLAATHADQVVVLDQGRVVADGSPGDVLTSDLLRAVWAVDAEVGPTGAITVRDVVPR